MAQLYGNTFEGGLDVDTSVNKYAPNKMYQCKNFRILGGETSTAQALTTINGNKKVIEFTSPADVHIIGLAEVDSSLIIFTQTETTTGIFKIPLEDISDEIISIDIGIGLAPYQKLSKNFKYNSESRVEVIAHRETNLVEKVYFTDRNSEIFAVNLADPDIQSYSINKFRLIPNYNISKFKEISLVPGQLTSGRIQYAYQYYNLNGSETYFSPVSEMMNLTPSSQSSTVRKYRGGDIGQQTNKGVRFVIENLDTSFDRIRLVRVHHQEFQAEPVIQIFLESVIPSNRELTVVDRGTNVLQELASEEFLELLLNVYPKTWNTKNSYLFIGDTTEELFDFEYDARAVRYNEEGESYLTQHDLKNPFNLLENDNNSNTKYRYHPTKTDPQGNKILGGAGENIEYWFRTKKVLLDSGIDYGAPYIKQATAKDASYANSELAAKYRGYARDEIYRFGLVGYKSGRPSFVKWVDDIRMPDFKDGEEVFEVQIPYTTTTWASKTVRLRIPTHTSNLWKVALRFVKDGQSETRTIEFNKPTESVTSSDVESFIETFNNNKVFGTIKIKELNYHANAPMPDPDPGFDPPGDVEPILPTDQIIVTFQDTAIEGDVTIGSYSFQEVNVGNHQYKVLSKIDYIVSKGYTTETYGNDYSLIDVEKEGEETRVYMNILYPVFQVTNLPPDIDSYQIVRVERDRENRTVIDTGHLAPLGRNPGDDFWEFSPFFTMPSAGRVLWDYSSIEHLTNKLEGVSGTRLDFITGSPWDEDDTYVHFYAGDGATTFKYDQYTMLPVDYSYLGFSVPIKDSMDFSYFPDHEYRFTFDQTQIKNLYSSWGVRVVRGSTKILKTTSVGIGIAEHHPIPDIHYGILGRRRNITYPYGGATISSLSNSVYIGTGKIHYNKEEQVEVFGGDVYIGMFNHLRGMSPESVEQLEEAKFYGLNVGNFPVESTINPELYSNPEVNSFDIRDPMDTAAKRLFLALKEESGAYIPPGDDEVFEQDFNLYSYNSVYSQPNSLHRFFPKPKDFQEVVEFPNRIYYSDKKVQGEAADSWMKFRPGNFMDVDTKYGKITALVTFRDNLFCFQEKGISILGVEQRELAQTDTPGPLVVGTGDTLTQPYYITTSSGVIDSEHIVASRNVLYFYDKYNNKIGRIIENGVDFISDTKFISNLVKPYWQDVHLSFNPRHNEIMFSYKYDEAVPFPDYKFVVDHLDRYVVDKDGKYVVFYNNTFLSLELNELDEAVMTKEETLVFNEYLDVFSGTYTHRHTKSQLGNHQLFTINRDRDLKSIYKDSVDESELIYSDYPEESIVTLIVNPQGNFISIYDVINLTLEVYQDGNLRPNETLSGIRCYNEWQDTGIIELVPNENIVQRFRTWRINSFPEYTEDESRLRSSSLFVDLLFDPVQNKKLTLHDVVTVFRPNTPYQQKSE